MNITPERKKSVDFSDPYYAGHKLFLINKADRNKYKSTKDFHRQESRRPKRGKWNINLVKENIPNVQERTC
jgi:ABC-type amino acid transport/signal transduction systems, periplasmic component/domain